jgi:hypothetical protein
MKISTNNFGEVVYKWENNIHPDNPQFMQKVLWTMWIKRDGTLSVCYKLDYNNKGIFLYNLTKEEILQKYYK